MSWGPGETGKRAWTVIAEDQDITQREAKDQPQDRLGDWEAKTPRSGRTNSKRAKADQKLPTARSRDWSLGLA